MKSIRSLLLATVAAGLALVALVPSAMGAEWSWTTYAGLPYNGGPGDEGSADGPRSVARFHFCRSVALDAHGNAYVADGGNNTIRKISAAGVVTTLAGSASAGIVAQVDGPGSVARFHDPSGVAVNADGSKVYVADASNNTIRQLSIDVSGAVTVSTLAGSATAGNNLYVNGTGSAARFYTPIAVALDSAGNVYVADYYNYTIRKITIDISGAATVSTVAGIARIYGDGDGAGSVAQFQSPFALTVDAAGNVYVADQTACTIRKISPNPDGTVTVSTLAGTYQSAGTTDGPGATAKFFYPSSVAVDAEGNLYVTDGSNCTIRKLTITAGVVTVSTIGGTPVGDGGPTSSTVAADGVGAAAKFKNPVGIAIDGNNRLFLGDYNRIVLGTFGGGVTPPPSGLTLAVTGATTNGAIIHFSAVGAAGAAVKVQSSSTPTDDSSWIDLPDGHGAAMAEKPAGHFTLYSTFYPTGTAVSFRAITADQVVSNHKGPYVLTRAALEISEQLSSPRDSLGTTTHIGDTLTCTFKVVNSGSATARNMEVEAPVPTYLPNILQNFDITTVGPKGATPGSTIATMATGDTSLLYAGMSLTQSKNPYLPATSITVASIIDDLHFNLSVAAIASGTAATTFNYQNGQVRQFTERDVKPSTYGKYVAATSATANDAKVVWKMGALNKGFQQFVSFTIHLSSNVSVAQNPGFLRNYEVYSTTLQPPYTVTGQSGGAAIVGTQLAPGMAMTMVRTNPGASVAPGGLITYTCTVSNFTNSRIAHGAAVVEVPANTRFGTTYPTGPRTSILGLSWPGTRGGPAGEQVFWTGLPAPRVVIPVMALAAHGKPGDTFSFNITFQVQWVDPSVVPTITTADFGAVFFDPEGFPVPYVVNGVTRYLQVHQVDFFKGYYHLAKSSTAGDPGATDFFSLIDNTNHELAVFKDVQHGGSVPLVGSAADGPKLSLGKVLMNKLTDLDPLTGLPVNVVSAGDYLTFGLTATNTGNAEADDVYIQDTLPDDTAEELPDGTTDYTFNLFGAKATATLDPKSTVDGHHHHIRFDGLRLAPGASLYLEYTVRVDGGGVAPAPARLTKLDAPDALDPESGLLTSSSIGSSSTPHTWPGLYVAFPMEVFDPVSFSQPIIIPFPTTPMVSTNPAATALVLDALSALDRADPIAPSKKVPGVVSYFMLYSNRSGHVVANADLAMALPAHTAFYRASFVNPAGAQIAPPKGASVIPPDGANNGRLATSGTVRFHFNTLAANTLENEFGAVVVQLIVTPDAVQSTGSFIGGEAGILVVMHDNPVIVADKKIEYAPLPRCAVSTGGGLAAAAVQGFKTLNALPDVPKIGILKIMPNVIPSGSVLKPTIFPITWVIFNTGDTDSGKVDFHFVQPGGTVFRDVNYTTAYNARTLVDGPTAQPGTELETIWDGIPAHSALAVTYTFTMTTAGPGTIGEATSAVDVPFMGSLRTEPTTTVITDPSVTVPAGQDSTYTRAIAGTPIHLFKINQHPVLIVDLGANQVFAEAETEIVAGGTTITIANGQSTVFGDASLVRLGATTAKFMLDHYADGTALAEFGTAPPTIVVPRNCSLLLDAALIAQKKITAIGVGGGAPLIANDGATVISNDGGSLVSNASGTLVSNGGGTLVSNGGGTVLVRSSSSLISQDGGGLVADKSAKLIANDGATIVAAGGGNIVASGGGNLVASGGGNFTSKTNGAVISSAPNSTGLVASGGGNLVASGGGNIVASGGGN